MAIERDSETGQTVIWQGIWRPGAEWCTLQGNADGWRLGGTALVAVEGAPWKVRYEIALDDGWVTREVQVVARAGGLPEERLRLTASEDRIWQVERGTGGAIAPVETLESVRGLIDIDLGFSPSTNTLPIRRLAPAAGEAVDVTAVWLRFPELAIEPLPQRYTRRDARRYRYESSGGAFVAELEVDDLGLVVSYEGGWKRIAASPLEDQEEALDTTMSS